MDYFLPGLYIVSTPIGNLEDITLRAINVLKNSDKILCEDTRRSIKLLNHYNIKKQLISYHKFNEKKSLIKIIQYLNEGKILSLISDAGTPVLSDPGNIIINECIKNKHQIFTVPGPSSVSTALTLARDHKLPIKVFNTYEPDALRKIICGEDIGTLIS